MTSTATQSVDEVDFTDHWFVGFFLKTLLAAVLFSAALMLLGLELVRHP